uniref:G domain-containing protein n=1 Tax=Panagrolaimus sp. JU765 TaxID=591449 RepID=A0AC34QCR2_9BILA
MSNSKLKTSWFPNTSQKEFNILLLGKSGHGKSTWINSIINFYKFGTLENALNHKPECIIPTCFEIPDVSGDYKMYPVTVGQKNDNERLELAKSSTQKPQVYSLKLDDVVVNFIDVPGILDDRGTEQDEINMRNILDTVGLFKNLHAICIMLNATESVMSTAYVYR